MGETDDEVRGALADLRAVGVDILTLGQYLRPSAEHLPVARWWTPDEFDALRADARGARASRTSSRARSCAPATTPATESIGWPASCAEILGSWPSASPRSPSDLAQWWSRAADVLRRDRAERQRRPRQPLAQGLRHACASSPTARVAYLDLTGSGVETIAHLRDNGRITLMACAFNGKPAHLADLRDRHGARDRFARVRRPGAEFPELPGRRAIIDVAVDRVTTSCGYAVPLMDLVDDRDRLLDWARPRATTGSRRTGRRRTR